MLLANVLRTLSDDELVRVRKEFTLGERSRLIFERVAAAASSPPDAESLAKALKLSKENFYRVCSEIVDECVRILAPKEEFSALRFFLSKYLYRPFAGELRRVEKKLIAERDRAALERFYEFVFLEGLSFPVSTIDLDLTEEMGAKWHRIKTDPPPDDELYIRIRIIFLHIGLLPSKKKMTMGQMAAKANALLEPVRDAARNSPNPLVRCFYFQTEWKASIFDRGLDENRIILLKKSLDVVTQNREWFNPDWEHVIELQIANELASRLERVEEAFAIYKKHYHGQTANTSRGALFLTRFMAIAFLAKDFITSWEIVQRFESSPAIRAVPSVHMMGILMRAKLELIEGNMKSAAASIEQARAANGESYFLAYELPIRGLETILELKRGNYEFTEQLVRRNIKWLRSRNISLSISAWIYFYRIVENIIHARMTGVGIRPSLLKHYNGEFRSEHPDFFLLLESELQQIHMIHRNVLGR